MGGLTTGHFDVSLRQLHGYELCVAGRMPVQILCFLDGNLLLSVPFRIWIHLRIRSLSHSVPLPRHEFVCVASLYKLADQAVLFCSCTNPCSAPLFSSPCCYLVLFPTLSTGSRAVPLSHLNGDGSNDAPPPSSLFPMQTWRAAWACSGPSGCAARGTWTVRPKWGS